MNSELTLVSLALFVSAWDLDLDGPRCPLGSSRLPCCSRDRSLCPGTERDKVVKFSKWRALRRRGDPGIDIPDSLPRTTTSLDRPSGE